MSADLSAFNTVTLIAETEVVSSNSDHYLNFAMDVKKPQVDITWENWKITINKQTFNACWVKKQLIMRYFWAKKWGNELFGGVLNEGPRTAADDGALTTDY